MRLKLESKLFAEPIRAIKPRRRPRPSIPLPPGPWPLTLEQKAQLEAIISAIIGRRQRSRIRPLPPQAQVITWPPKEKWPLWFYARDKEIEAYKATDPKDALIKFNVAKFARLMAQDKQVISFTGTYISPGQGRPTFCRFGRKINESLFGKRYRFGSQGITATGAIETTRDKARPRAEHEHIHAVIAGPLDPLLEDKARPLSDLWWASGGGIHKVKPIKDTEGLERTMSYAFKAYPESEVVELDPYHRGAPERARGEKGAASVSPGGKLQGVNPFPKAQRQVRG